MRIQALQTIVFAPFLLMAACTSIIPFSSTSLPDDSIFKDFVGEYSLDDSYGGKTFDLTINPDKTFTFLTISDAEGIWQQSGPIEPRDGALHLVVSFSILALSPDPPKYLIPIKWEQRRYLIEADKIETFCENVKKGDEPRNSSIGFSYLKNGDWAISVSGVPISYDGKVICP